MLVGSMIVMEIVMAQMLRMTVAFVWVITHHVQAVLIVKLQTIIQTQHRIMVPACIAMMKFAYRLMVVT